MPEKFMHHSRWIILLCLLSTIQWATRQSDVIADDAESTKKESERVQLQVRAIQTAVYKGDIEGVLKYTHPKVIDALGGPEKTREILHDVLKGFLAKGVRMDEFKIAAEPTFVQGTTHEFVIVPTRAIIGIGETRIESSNFQLGIKPLGKGDWTYVEGSRINQGNVNSWFPDFPKDVALPKTSRKKIEGD